jgi:hypothetical protein
MASEITSANVATAIVKLVASQTFSSPWSARLVMGNLVNRNYETTLAAAGDVVNVPIAPNMSANNIAEAGSGHKSAEGARQRRRWSSIGTSKHRSRFPT